MHWNIRKSPAMVSTELAISITLVVAALFVTLGLFGGNLKEMVSRGNFQRFFLGSDKTTYSAFNRDYSDSAIESIMTGEQGLEVIRRKANNMAHYLINEGINAKKTNLTGKDSNSIYYLGLVIKAIVGEPHICVIMKKDSDANCTDPEIGGYDYAIESNLTKVRALQPRSQSPTNYLPNVPALTLTNLDTSLASLASEITTNMSTDNKTEFTKIATLKAQPVVKPSVLLANVHKKFKSHDPNYTAKDFAKDLTAVAKAVYDSADISNDKSTTHHKKCKEDWPWNGVICDESPQIDNNDLIIMKKWYEYLNGTDGLSSKDSIPEISELFLSSMDTYDITNRANDDKYLGSDSPCNTMIKGLVAINEKHSDITLESLGFSTPVLNQYIITAAGKTCTMRK